jgi:hypothetical protein
MVTPLGVLRAINRNLLCKTKPIFTWLHARINSVYDVVAFCSCDLEKIIMNFIEVLKLQNQKQN